MFPFYVILPENDKEDISLKQINETYFTNPNPKNMTDIESIIGDDEQILWRGKPKKNAYVLNAIFKMLPIALIWLLFDGVFIGVLFGTGFIEDMPPFAIIFFIIFFLFHLAPVWIWAVNIITAARQHKNLEYVFTNKRIIIKSGIIGIDFKNLYYPDIQAVNLKVGFIDKMLKVGDVYVTASGSSSVLFDIEDPYFITQKLQEIVIDIKTDVQFPNDLRPKTNHGYQTTHKGN